MAKIKEMFEFAYGLVKSLAVKVKNDFVNAACKPSFAESVFDIIGMLFTYAFYMALVLCIAFAMFIVALIVLCVIYSFPVACGAIVLGVLLLMLAVKLVRLAHKDLVKQAKEEREREIDTMISRWSIRHAS